MIMLTMELTIEYANPSDAEAVYSSSKPDDDTYVTTEVSGNKVIYRFRAESAGQMRSAMDDVLACVKVSEEALGLVSGARSDPDGDSLLE